MAIKGKGKTRPRQVARAPRAQIQPVKPPLFQRRWVQMTGAALLTLFVILLLGWIRAGLRRESAQKARTDLTQRERAGVGEYASQVDAALQPIGQASSALSFTVLPDLSTAVTDLKAGNTTSTKASATAQRSQTLAATAQKAIEGVSLDQVVQDDFSRSLTLNLFDSQQQMSEGLALYADAASLLEAGAKAGSDSDRQAFLTNASSVLDTASRLFSDGYRNYNSAKAAVGLFNPLAGTSSGGGFPGGTAPGVGLPGATGSGG